MAKGSTFVNRKSGKVPQHFSFGCYCFSVKQVPEQELRTAMEIEGADEVFGAINNNEQLILLNEDMSPQTKRETLLHEITHAIVFNNSIGTVAAADDMENIVDRVAAGVYEVIKRNPDIVKRVMEE